MPFNKSLLAMEDVRTILDRALAAKTGIRFKLKSSGEAMYFRGRANYFRRLDRVENSKIYPEGHELHKQSIYDRLKVVLKDDGVVEIVKVDQTIAAMEEF